MRHISTMPISSSYGFQAAMKTNILSHQPRDSEQNREPFHSYQIPLHYGILAFMPGPRKDSFLKNISCRLEPAERANHRPIERLRNRRISHHNPTFTFPPKSPFSASQGLSTGKASQNCLTFPAITCHTTSRGLPSGKVNFILSPDPSHFFLPVPD